MNEIILGIGVAAFVVYAAFSIFFFIDMKKTGNSVNAFLKNTECNLNSTLVELKGTLENLRKISGDIGAVTEDVKQISNSVASVERSMWGLYDYMKEGLGSAAGARIAGLKAGITTGVSTLVKSMQKEKGDDHERRNECQK